MRKTSLEIGGRQGVTNKAEAPKVKKGGKKKTSMDYSKVNSMSCRSKKK